MENEQKAEVRENEAEGPEKQAQGQPANPSLIEAPKPKQNSAYSPTYSAADADGLDHDFISTKEARKFWQKQKNQLLVLNVLVALATIGTLAITYKQLIVTAEALDVSKKGIEQAAEAIKQTNTSLLQTDTMIGEAKKQTKASERSADATVDQAKSSRAALRQAHEDSMFGRRPWLAIDTESMGVSPLTGRTMTASYKIRNIGESPATFVYVRSMFVETEEKAREAAQVLRGPLDPKEIHSSISKGEARIHECGLVDRPFSLPTKLVDRRSGDIFFLARIRYKDMGEEHTFETGYCARVILNRGPNPLFGSCGFNEYFK